MLFGYGLIASGSSVASMVGGGLGLALGSAVGLALYFGLLKILCGTFSLPPMPC